MATFQPISSQELECPICLTLFSQPKALTCSHTFCENCLARIFQTQPNQQTITCPVCRKGTPVPSGDVSKLQTNAPLSSLVDEVKTKNPTCTNCGIDQESPTVFYCQDCGKYMCKACEINHFGWKSFSTHSVVEMSDVLSGKVVVKRRRKCKKHPNEDEDCFCPNCREYTCNKCWMLKHLQEGHKLEEAVIHEEKLIENIKKLKEKTKSKKTTIENHIEFIETQRNEVTRMLRKLNDDIEKTYEESMQLLLDRREALKSQVKRLSEKFEKELQTMREESRQTVSHMNAVEELVTNGTKIPLEKDALFVHDTLCENLESLLGRDDPDDQSPRGVTERAEKISFSRQVKVHEHYIGELKTCSWDVKVDVMELPSKDKIKCMICAPDGKMAVGLDEGGIHIFSPDGETQQTVLKDVGISDFRFLSDGRSVVLNSENEISMYTPQWEKLDNEFETMSCNRTDCDGLAVDKDDNICVCYSKSPACHQIQVFAPQGGEPVREITFDNEAFVPVTLFSFHTSRNFIVNEAQIVLEVMCINSNGKKENVLRKEGMLGYPAVCRDDSVIVAWVDYVEDTISIDRYTKDLEHMYNIISDFKIQNLVIGSGCNLQEFESGEIAFTTADRVYIFVATKCEI